MVVIHKPHLGVGNVMPVVSTTACIRIYILSFPEIYADGLAHLLSVDESYAVQFCHDPESDWQDQLLVSRPQIFMINRSIVSKWLAQRTLDTMLADFQKQLPDTRIVLFGNSRSDDTFVRRMISAGVRGFVDGNMSSDRLRFAINEVHAGSYWVDRAIMNELVQDAVAMEKTLEASVASHLDDLHNKITRREADVLQLVLEGMSTREIATTMHLSEQGVKLHLGRLFKKFQVINRAQLILMVYSRVCPVNNMHGLIRGSFDKRRAERGFAPFLDDE